MTDEIFLSITETLESVQDVGREVIVMVETMRNDLRALQEDLAKNPSPLVRGWIVDEIQEIIKSRKLHILATIEAQAGIQVSAVANAALDVGLSILLRVIKGV